MELSGARALVDFNGVRRRVTAALLPDLKVGDYVVVHAGCAIAVMSEEEAKASLAEFERLAKEDGLDLASLT